MLPLLLLTGVMSVSFRGSVDVKEVKDLKIYINNINETRVDKYGNFIFSDIALGTYLLTVSHNTYNFPQYEVTVTPEGNIVYELDDKGLLTPVALPLTVNPKGFKKYYDIEETFAIASLLQSPYAILIPVGLGLLFCLRYLPGMESLQNADRHPSG